MVSIKRMNEISRILSKAIYNKKYQNLTSKQSTNIAKKVTKLIKWQMYKQKQLMLLVMRQKKL